MSRRPGSAAVDHQSGHGFRPATRVLYSRIVPEPVVEIPNRPAFRAAEVCDIAQIPAYVLKSWEKEFPGLGVAARPGAPRVYRRADVEQVLRIKHLLFNEGLTLAGARRKLEGEPKVEEEPLPELPAAPGDVREKVARVKQELRSLLALLSAPAPAAEQAARREDEAGIQGAAETGPVPGAAAAPEAPAAADSPAAPPDPAGTASPSAPWASSTTSTETAAPRAEGAQDLPLLEGIPDKGADARPARRPRRAAARSPREAS